MKTTKIPPMQLPPKQTPEAVYSNLDHEFLDEVVDELLADPDLHAQHAAWNFCGYVWHTQHPNLWWEQVWVYGSPVETRSHEDLRELIDGVNDEYGSE